MANFGKSATLVGVISDRLRAHPLHTLSFALIGLMTAVLVNLPEAIMRIESRGWTMFLQRWPRQLLGFFAMSLFVAVVLRAATGKHSNMTQRPLKFLAILVLGTTLASLLGLWLSVSIGGSRHLALADLPLQMVFDTWLQATVWGGLIGWLYLLSLQHTEDRERLNGLLGKRALLARQLARSRLGAVRAQIDPAMVARILTEVHRRYRSDTVSASDLLDHLIRYLRMALNRERKTTPSVDSDLALLRDVLDNELNRGTPPHVPNKTD